MDSPLAMADAVATAAALLPPAATQLEKAIFAAELVQMARTDAAEILKTWDPERCDAALLPFLAWGLSVDVWDNAWPESQKRAAIAAAPDVHRFKGTAFAVNRALEVLEYEFSVEEWWQTQPVARRGTFDVKLEIDSDVLYERPDALGAAARAQALASIRSAKPKSRIFEASFGVRTGVKDFVGVSAIAKRTAIAGLPRDVDAPPVINAHAVSAVSARVAIAGLA